MTDSGYLKENREIIRKLRAITALKFIKEDDLRGLLKSSKMIKYEPGETIIEEGQYSSWIYFLITGKVGIYKQGETIAVLRRQGDLFGEMGIIDQSPRSASIIAVDESVCLTIDASYSDKLKGHEKAAFNAVLYRIFAEILAERLRAADEEIVKMKDENAILRSELKKSSELLGLD
ncbi:MAG: cyclic nucleotide-binding domain-containing protein [Deltaproteobacteria bacterium]|nr:cyclic nucleotide-binding domain-containing protein [Deltaproteobacteria bacterium]